MKSSVNVSRFTLTLFLLLTFGCASIVQSSDRASVTREDEISQSVDGAISLSAKTHNGSIKISGTDGDAILVKALIKAKAPRRTTAKDLLSQTRVKLRRSGSKWVVDVERPKTRNNQSVHVDVEAPRGLAYEFKTHNGGATVVDVASVSGTTHNGGIKVNDIAGAVAVESHNGSIRASNLGGAISIETHNGSVTVQLDDVSSSTCAIETHNGKIDFDAPDDFSAQVSVRAHNGSITTGFPVTVVGTRRHDRRR